MAAVGYGVTMTDVVVVVVVVVAVMEVVTSGVTVVIDVGVVTLSDYQQPSRHLHTNLPPWMVGLAYLETV